VVHSLLHRHALTREQIDQAQVGTRPLISIPLEFRAIDAFVMMIEYHLSALCFLGEEGEVSGNISVKDLKGVLLDFNALIHPVADYVNMIRRDNVRVRAFPLMLTVAAAVSPPFAGHLPSGQRSHNGHGGEGHR
jgi:CBS domain-containing protein